MAAILAVSSLAQTAAPPEAIEEVVVVGTAIRGTPIDAPHAVSVVDRDALERQGFPLMVDLFKRLGASNGVVGERSSWYNTNLPGAVPESVSNVNLRGLGASRSLVLINGRRQTYLPARLIGGRFVDVGVLPAIALDRIELLKEGASAIYGSDAVGGIANFVTRGEFEGFEAVASYDDFDGASNWLAGMIGGGSFGSSRVVVSVEHERRGELRSEEREWALRPLLDPWRAAWSSVGNPGYFWFPRDIDTATTPRSEVIDTLKVVQWRGKADPACNGLNGYPPHPAVDPYFCIFNYQPFDNLIEEQRHTRALAEASGVFGSGIRYRLEGLRSEAAIPRWRTQPSHPPFPLLHRGVMEVAPDHPGRVAFCADRDYGRHFRAECMRDDNWYWRGRPFGNGDRARLDRRSSAGWRVAGNISGEFDGPGDHSPHYDLGLSHSAAKSHVGIPAVLTERLFLAFRGYGGADCGVGVVADTALGPGMRVAATDKAPGTEGCGYYNPFGSASQYSSLPGAPYYDAPNPHYDSALANSRELFDWLNGSSDIDSETGLTVADAALSGRWLEERVGYAVGYQFRRFVAAGEPNPHGNLAINPCPVIGDRNCGSGNFGPFISIHGYNPYKEYQRAHRAFGELAIDLSGRIDVHLATNYERYDHASSLDPKLAARFRLTETLTLRAAAQTTFRNPSVDDVLDDVPLTVTSYVSQVGAWIPVDIRGDPSLAPERAITYNFGVVVLADSGIELTVDYWYYDFQDVIGSLPHDTIDEIYANLRTRDGVARHFYCADGRADTVQQACGPRSVTSVEVPLVNWPGVETSGLDWEFRWTFDADVGALATGVAGTYTRGYHIKALHLDGVLIEDAVEAAGRLNFGNPLAVPIPRWKGQAYATFRRGDYSVNVHFHHTSSYLDEASHDGYGGVPVDDFRIGRFTTVDVSLQRRMRRPGLYLALAFQNLTDEPPPFANVEHAYDGLTHNPRGRQFKLILQYRRPSRQ